MPDRTQSTQLLLRVALGAVLFTFGLGVWMRLTLGGLSLGGLQLPGSFAHVRHAHSHAGYFGVLFPLAWLRWSSAGAGLLPRAWLGLYAAATAVACVGFAFVGYQVVTIAASSVLGALWIAAAWRARSLWRGPDAWLRAGPLCTAFACLWVPPIGALTPRDPALGASIAHSFLAFLLFTVMLPAALSRVRAPAVPLFLWLPLAIVAAFDVGALPHPIAGAALVLYAAVIGRAALLAHGDTIARAGLVIFAAGAVLVGARIVELSQAVAMAGVHLAVLGAALTALLPTLSRAHAVVLLSAAIGMASSLVLAPVLGVAAQVAAALAGALALIPAVRTLLRHRADDVQFGAPEPPARG